jgi:hypothetical protein
MILTGKTKALGGGGGDCRNLALSTTNPTAEMCSFLSVSCFPLEREQTYYKISCVLLPITTAAKTVKTVCKYCDVVIVCD